MLTFEELAGIFEAKDIDLAAWKSIPTRPIWSDASACRPRLCSVAAALPRPWPTSIKEMAPGHARSRSRRPRAWRECKKLLMLAKAGKYNGYLLEGMGCPGGCIGGAGTIADPAKTAILLNKYVKEAPFADPEESPFMSNIHMLKDDPNFEV